MCAQASWHPLVDMFVVGRYPKGNFQEKSGKRALCTSDRGVIDFFDVNSENLKPAFSVVDPNRKGLFPVCKMLHSLRFLFKSHLKAESLFSFQLNAFSMDGSYLASAIGTHHAGALVVLQVP